MSIKKKKTQYRMLLLAGLLLAVSWVVGMGVIFRG